MTTKSSVNVAYLLIGGRDVLPASIQAITENRERLTQDTTGASQDTDYHTSVGQQVFELTVEGLYDTAVGGFHAALQGTDPQILMYAPVGDDAGDPLVAFRGVRSTYNRTPARGRLHRARAVYRADTGPEAMGLTHVSAPLTARTTVGPTDTAADNWLADSDNGGTAYLTVTALNLDGGTNVAITIRDSADDITYADLVAFTAVTTAPNTQRVVIAGTIDQYTLTRHEFTGAAGGSRSITFTTGIARY